MKIPENIEKNATKIVLFINRVLELVFMLVIVMALLMAAYALWDSKTIYTNASPEKYEVYRPTANHSVSFQELQNINNDVFAWLTIYGTNIDYPLVVGEDNAKYLNRDPMGEYSLSGSIFLDYRFSKDLVAFNNLFYGHHMAEGMMFGDIDLYESKGFFDSHRYGTIYYNGEKKGIEIVALLHGDAADKSLFAPPAETESAKQDYLAAMQEHAVYIRDKDISLDNTLLVLSTCATGDRTDRHFLIAKISDRIEKNMYPKVTNTKEHTDRENSTANQEFHQVGYGVWIALGVVIALLVVNIFIRIRCGKNHDSFCKK